MAQQAPPFFMGLKPSIPDDRDHLFGVEQPRAFGPIDLRDLFPAPTDQMQTSACTSHCATKLRAYLANRWARDNGQTPDHRYSELWEYWHTRVEDGDPGQDAGASMRSMCDAMLNNGALPYDEWPWDQAQILQPPSSDLDLSHAEGISGYARVGGGTGMDLNGSIQAALNQGSPVGLAIAVFPNFFYPDSSGLSPLPARGSRSVGGHAIPVAAWEPSGDPGGGRYWWCGSWGTSFSKNGWSAISAAFVSKYCQEAWLVA